MDRTSGISNMRFIAFVYTLIVWLWGFYLLSSFAGVDAAQAYLWPLLPALPLLVATFIFVRQSRRLLQGPVFFADKRHLLIYLGVVALMIVAIVAVNNIFRFYHISQWQWPASIFLVGLHFLGLIPVFKRWGYLLFTTLVFCLPALLVPIFVPQTYMLGALSIRLGWQFATALVVWPWFLVGAILLLVRGTQLLQKLRAERTASVQRA
jgi:hypothetical protein